MKKIIITMLVAMIFLATAEAKPIKKVVPKKETTEKTVEKKNEEQAEEPADKQETRVDATEKVNITKNGITINKDGKTVKVKIGDLERIINSHLDDTILSADGIIFDEGETEQDGNETLLNERLESNHLKIARDGMDLARDITEYFAIAVVWIVALSLLFYYLHRRRKYKTVERAIQAGYPLPDEFFGKRSQRAPQQPTNVYVTQVTPPAPDPNAPQGAQPAPGMSPGYSSNPINNITDWAPFKGGFTTTAVGLGLMLFFLVAGAEPIAALMVIVVLIGLGKLFITYKEQQSLKNYWQNQQWQQQWSQQPQQSSAQQASQQWQQWSQPQQTEDVPPMPETPPEFNENA